MSWFMSLKGMIVFSFRPGGTTHKPSSKDLRDQLVERAAAAL